MMQLKRRAHKQKGFTLIEIMVAIAIVALLAAMFLPGLMRKREDAKYSTALTMLQKDFPGSIATQVSRTNICLGMVKQDLLDRGVPNLSVWNLPWTLDSATASLVTISYPIDSTDASTAATLVTALTQSSNISSATATGNTKVTVAYRCN
jgi:prepilin-type N-terminal cleavage/methylation domain-containing protein